MTQSTIDLSDAPRLAVHAQLAAMGHDASPETLTATRALYAEDQQRLATDLPVTVADLRYGPDPRHTLDLYQRIDGDGDAPILLWVHGGGFLRGAKSDPAHPYEAHFGRFAARNGFLGVVINYRLTPEHCWPAGAEDVGLAIDWLVAHAARYSGDPRRIVLIGSSAGAAHIATFFQVHPGTTDVKGAVLLSGLYGYTAPSERDMAYYGADLQDRDDRASHSAVCRTDVPLLVACAEFDPPRFQSEFVDLLRDCLAVGGHLPRSIVASGHNHFSLAYHIGTADRRVSDQIVDFARACVGSDDAPGDKTGSR